MKETQKRLIGEQVHRVLDAIGKIVDIWIGGNVEAPVDPPAPPEDPEPMPPPAPLPERENGWHVLADLTQNLTAAQTYLRQPAVFDLDDFMKRFPDYKVIDLYDYFETAKSNRYALTDKEPATKILFRASKPLKTPTCCSCSCDLFTQMTSGWRSSRVT